MISVDHYMAWVSIDIHGDSLEFVLLDAQQRNDEPDGYYSDALWRALEEEFKDERWLRVSDKQVYGSISLSSKRPLSKSCERCCPALRLSSTSGSRNSTWPK